MSNRRRPRDLGGWWQRIPGEDYQPKYGRCAQCDHAEAEGVLTISSPGAESWTLPMCWECGHATGQRMVDRNPDTRAVFEGVL